MPPGDVHLEIRGVGKSFGGTRALNEVSVEIQVGSVHAFVGENGAGKSTLGKIVGGVFPQDQGQLVLKGEPVAQLDGRSIQPFLTHQLAEGLKVPLTVGTSEGEVRLSAG